ncbi:hypothetical protein FB566_1810 [Stackebrandtia endophytica]|uniref:Uncharacterized protein n=1 Tax=Stackebrandtia endophytica TaxID=1496996 RepID=A0A543AUM3_9ACTN|nr:hypothetical protein [Stackebrandtia endophytica]TQL76286.1 hypothetical protein FB566_1810 [Stackebrandtia endophytica]
MGNDVNHGKSVAVKIGTVASVIGILAFFGISNWQDLTSKLFGIEFGAEPSGTELFPVSFSHHDWTFTATSRPDVWDECPEAWGCVANIQATYTAEDPGMIAMVSVTRYSDHETAARAVDDQRSLEESMGIDGQGYSAVSGVYSVRAAVWDFIMNDPKAASYAIGRLVLDRLPTG